MHEKSFGVLELQHNFMQQTCVLCLHFGDGINCLNANYVPHRAEYICGVILCIYIVFGITFIPT